MHLNRKKQIDYFFGRLLLFLFKFPTMVLGALLRRDHSPTLREEVCFIKMQGGGSLVIAYPALLGLKKRYPDCRLRIVCTGQVEHFAATLNVFDEIFVIDDRSVVRLIGSGLRALWNNLFVDTVIDFEVYSRLTSIFSLATCARNRAGFYLESTFWRENICSHLVFFNRFSGSYHFYEDVARLFDAEPLTFVNCREFLIQPSETLSFEAASHNIAIGHSCSELGRERMLNEQQWKSIIHSHATRYKTVNVIFLGGKGDAAKAEQIIACCGDEGGRLRFINLCGKLSLRHSIVCIGKCNEFIGIDSGLLHFARLLGVHCTSFWGPTDPNTRLKPIDGLDETIYYRKIPCSPCIHVAETPPCRGANVCIDNLFNPVVDKSLAINNQLILNA